MTAALALPTSQTLAGWGRQIAARPVQALWTGYLRLHRIEALVEIAHTCPLDVLSRLLLTTLGLETESRPPQEQHVGSNRDSGALATSILAATLGFDRPFLCRLLSRLERESFVIARGRGEEPEAWARTAEGKQALEQGARSSRTWERRTFSFVARWDSACQPLFISGACLTSAAPQSGLSPPGEGLDFDYGILTRCVGESAAWKQRHGFPEDIVDMASGPAAADLTRADIPEVWRRILVDRQETCYVLLLREPGRLLGLPVRLPGWTLQADQPCFTLEDGDWDEHFPEVKSDLPLDVWRSSWLAWGRSRGLPMQELDACVIEPAGTRLRVRVESHFLNRLRSIRNETLRGETWLLAGAGALRACAAVEIVEP